MSSSLNSKAAVIILFHGSRAAQSEDAAKNIANVMRMRGFRDLVVPAFLQHGSPDLAGAMRICVAEKVTRVVIVPFFMQTGMHVTADVPDIVRELQARNPSMAITLTDAVGTHPLMVDIVIDLAKNNNPE